MSVIHLGILTQYYPPEIGAPQSRLSDLARRLVERGHKVVVVTAMPNYPLGRRYNGYGGLGCREELEGAVVWRSYIYPTKSVATLQRLFHYFTFVLSSLLVGVTRLRRLDYLMTESPPLFLGLTGFLLARLKRARWIFNVSDLWPETAVRLGVVREGWALSAARRLESFCYRKAWVVTGQSREILEDIERRFPRVRTYHLSNGVDTSLFRPERRSAAARARLLESAAGDQVACVAVYAGLHGTAQGLDQILAAVARLDGRGPLTVFIGDGPEREALIRRKEELRLDRVRFLDPLPREEIPALLASADIALVPLKVPLPGAVPSKVYEAMASGVPVLLVANGEAADIVRSAGAGLVVAPGDIDGLADGLRRLANNVSERRTMGEAGRRAAVAQFDRRQIAARFLRYLEENTAC